MKTIIGFVASFFLVTGCAGVGGEGPIAYPSGGHAPGGDDSTAKVSSVAKAETPARETLGGFHPVRHDVDYLVCAQCRH